MSPAMGHSTYCWTASASMSIFTDLPTTTPPVYRRMDLGVEEVGETSSW